jgi:peptidoglycan glycosyltransferase
LLLVAASPVIIVLFCLAILNDGQALNFETLAVPLGLFAAFLAAHLAVRWLAPNADPAILPLSFVLSGIGIAFVLRLAPETATRQLMWLFLSIAAMIATLALVRSVRKLGAYKYTIMLAGIILLLLPAFIGVELNGSKIWISFAGFSAQPGEIAKVLIVLALAGYLAENREMLSASRRRVAGIGLPDLKTLVPLLIMWGISMLVVVFERDLGSALLFFGIFIVMLYAATGRKTFVIAAVGLGAVGAVGAFFLFSHVQTRVNIWLDPFAYAQTGGSQLVQTIYSMADGEFIGTGIGRGMPRTIPLVASDFIFAAIGEETGLLGATGVLICFLLFAMRSLATAARAKSDMEAFAATGFTAAIALQAFVIVGGVTRLIPLTGVTLPFMSQGGSSLLASFIIVALLLRISDSATGISQEMEGTASLDGGILGRVALGRRLTVLITIFALLFAALIANLTYHMIVEAPAVRALPSNGHVLAAEQKAQRGSIITADGKVLAKSEPDGSGGYNRSYPQKTMAAQLLGYVTGRYGASGLEATQTETLRGVQNFSTWGDVVNAMAGIPVAGNDIQLSLDSRLQKAAESALAGGMGAAVALDAKTGEVLAMASAPTYDINNVEQLLAGDTQASGGSGALFNRAANGLYAPGSTFKVVTLTAALERGGLTLADTFKSPASIEIGNAKITNFRMHAYGTISLQKALAVSSNTVFAQVADEVGSTKLVAQTNAFGFGQSLGRDFATMPSLMPEPSEMTQWETAWSGVGQPVGEHASPPGPQASVTQIASVAAAIANEGVVMQPYVVSKVLAPTGQVVKTNAPAQLSKATTANVASDVKKAMRDVVQQGSGTSAAVAGYKVYGKTGTAQTGAAVDNSWFAGFIELKGRTVAVAIVLEQSEYGQGAVKAQSIFAKAAEIWK